MRRSGFRTRLERAERRQRPEQRRRIIFSIYEDEAPTSTITGIQCLPGGTITRKRGETFDALLARVDADCRLVYVQYDRAATVRAE